MLDAQADLAKQQVTYDEAPFITFLLLHLSTTFRGMKAGMFVTRQALEKDIRWFLSLPIPDAVWQKVKVLLEACRVAIKTGIPCANKTGMRGRALQAWLCAELRTVDLSLWTATGQG